MPETSSRPLQVWWAAAAAAVPNMAQAGGKNPAGVDEALAKVAETVESQVR